MYLCNKFLIVLVANWQQYSLNDSSRTVAQVYKTSGKVKKIDYENCVGTLTTNLTLK